MAPYEAGEKRQQCARPRKSSSGSSLGRQTGGEGGAVRGWGEAAATACKVGEKQRGGCGGLRRA
ncbi:hypothetical protein E2562_009806 [Oryza meyeriana var. granulata]|uniref:Uncharacterized protein n=1 Tax=Oryza meyeriana var. granulata TaxID=110450 RepID=A0A6G1BTQ8_9ORYZ|nr:hypothetical protein E2562_009806 [Oryza meyeriana var. granulata]